MSENDQVVQQPAYRPPKTGWAFLLRAPKLAMASSRLGLALLLIALVMGLGVLFDYVRGDVDAGGLDRGVFETLSLSLLRGVGEMAQGVMTLDPGRAIGGLVSGLYVGPSMLARVAPWSLLALVIVLIPAWTLLGGAIARSAAVEAARDQSISSVPSLAYAFSKRGSLVGSYVIPLAVAGALMGLLWLYGFALLSLPIVNLLGGLLYGAALAMGLALSLLAWGLGFGFPLLIPAVSADASDGIDAVQRAYSYLLDRPLKLLLWAVGLIAAGAATLFIVALLLTTAANLAASLALPTGDGEGAIAGDLRLFAPVPERPELEGSRAVVVELIGVWERIVLALAAAYAVSYFFCASTLVYLRIREACDGQAIEDIWPRRTVLEAVRRGEIEPLVETETEAAKGPDRASEPPPDRV